LIPCFDTRYGGMYRWQLAANFLLLRIVSFNMDAHWAYQFHHKLPLKSITSSDPPSSSTCETDKTSPDYTLDSNLRTSTPRPEDEYNFVHYLSYCLYCPLYMAGPVLSFNAFASYTSAPRHRPGTAQLPPACIVFSRTLLLGCYT